MLSGLEDTCIGLAISEFISSSCTVILSGGEHSVAGGLFASAIEKRFSQEVKVVHLRKVLHCFSVNQIYPFRDPMSKRESYPSKRRFCQL